MAKHLAMNGSRDESWCGGSLSDVGDECTQCSDIYRAAVLYGGDVHDELMQRFAQLSEARARKREEA